MMYGYGYGPAANGGWFVGMGLMAVFGLIAIAGVILLIVWGVRSAEHQHPGQQGMHHVAPPGMQQPVPPASPPAAPMDPAVEAARMRFAKGEISRKDYEDILKTLAR